MANIVTLYLFNQFKLSLTVAGVLGETARAAGLTCLPLTLLSRLTVLSCYMPLRQLLLTYAHALVLSVLMEHFAAVGSLPHAPDMACM